MTVKLRVSGGTTSVHQTVYDEINVKLKTVDQNTLQQLHRIAQSQGQKPQNMSEKTWKELKVAGFVSQKANQHQITAVLQAVLVMKEDVVSIQSGQTDGAEAVKNSCPRGLHRF